jgi:DNA-binding NtrC family response regulator
LRELRNLIERLMMMTRSEKIGGDPGARPAPGALAARDALVEESLAEVVDYRARVENLERQMLSHFARSCRSTDEIARQTGLTQSAVVRKLKKTRSGRAAAHRFEASDDRPGVAGAERRGPHDSLTRRGRRL